MSMLQVDISDGSFHSTHQVDDIERRNSQFREFGYDPTEGDDEEGELYRVPHESMRNQELANIVHTRSANFNNEPTPRISPWDNNQIQRAPSQDQQVLGPSTLRDPATGRTVGPTSGTQRDQVRASQSNPVHMPTGFQEAQNQFRIISPSPFAPLSVNIHLPQLFRPNPLARSVTQQEQSQSHLNNHQIVEPNTEIVDMELAGDLVQRDIARDAVVVESSQYPHVDIRADQTEPRNHHVPHAFPDLAEVVPTTSPRADSPATEYILSPLHLNAPHAESAEAHPVASPSLQRFTQQHLDENTCSICLEPWANIGNHRLVTLRCGHLFGRHCVVRWIKTKSECPTCKKKAVRKDVWNLFAPSHLKALDTSELEDMKQQLIREVARRKAAESRLSMEEMKIRAMEQHLEQSKKAYMELKGQIQQAGVKIDPATIRSSELPGSFTIRQHPFALAPMNTSDTTGVQYEHFKLSLRGGGRSVDIEPGVGGSIVAARYLDANMRSRGYCLSRFSSIDPNRGISSSRGIIHTMTIRDIRCCPHETSNTVRGIIATVGQDSKLKLIHPESSFQVTATFPLPVPGNCISWMSNPNHIAVGGNKASVYLFDIRQTASHFAEFSAAHGVDLDEGLRIPASFSPIHSLAWNPITSDLYAASHDSLYEWAIHPLSTVRAVLERPRYSPLWAYCHSLSMVRKPSRDMVLASFRHMQNRSAHMLGKWDKKLSDGESHVLYPYRLVGHESKIVLSRTAAVQGVDSTEDVVVFGGDDLTGRVYMWQQHFVGSVLEDGCGVVLNEQGIRQQDEMLTSGFMNNLLVSHKAVLPGSHDSPVCDIRVDAVGTVIASVSEASLIIHRAIRGS